MFRLSSSEGHAWGAKTRGSLTSGLPSRSNNPEVCGVAGRVRTKLLARTIPYFAYNSLASRSMQYYQYKIRIKWASGRRRPCFSRVQDIRNTDFAYKLIFKCLKISIIRYLFWTESQPTKDNKCLSTDFPGFWSKLSTADYSSICSQLKT